MKSIFSTKKQLGGNRVCGFSLVETILYIGLLALILVSLVSFGVSIAKSRAKVFVAQEVQTNMRAAIDIMSERIRAAQSVYTAGSVFNSNPGTLILFMDDVSKNETTFSLTAPNGRLQIVEGTADPIYLTNNDISVTNLTFQNQTGTNTHDTVGIQMTFEYVSANVVDYTYSTSITTSVSVRE